MNTDTTAPAPAATELTTYRADIAAETYAGRYTITRRNAVADTFTAAELADLNPNGAVFTSAGRMRNGLELFGRDRYVADAEGNLHVYASNGQKVIIHPAARKLRVLTRR